MAIYVSRVHTSGLKMCSTKKIYARAGILETGHFYEKQDETTDERLIPPYSEVALFYG
jgi:hypothetical protein